MSLASSPDYLFRPEDQALKMLFPNIVEDSSSFDNFFDEEMYKLDASSEESSGHPNNFEHLFTAEAFTDDPYRLPSLSDSPKLEQSPIQPWREGVWCLKQNHSLPLPLAPAPLVVEKTRRRGPSTSEPVQTMNVINHNYRGSMSPPDYHYDSHTKRRPTSPTPTTLKNTNYSRPPISREVTLSPSPMYGQFPVSSQYGHDELGKWQQDFQNFHLRYGQDQQSCSPLVSPSRETQPQSRLAATKMNTAVMTANRGVDVSSPPYNHAYMASNYHNVAIDPVLLGSARPNRDRAQPAQSHESLIPKGLRTTRRRLSVRSPPSESLPSSSNSNHSRGMTSHTSNTNRSVHSQALASPTSISSHPPLPHLAPEELYPALAAPRPQRLPHQILHQASEGVLSNEIDRYPDADHMHPTRLYESQAYYRLMPTDVGVAVPYPAPTTAPPIPLGSYPPLPPPPSYVFSDNSPFTPRKQRRSPSRSQSPSVSPTSASPRRHPYRSPARTVTDYTHSRRKSIHKSGPMKDTGQHDPMPTPRARSHSRPPRTPKTPRTATDGRGMIDFVNFTPKDSAKLLNDVAPSGSSKTRARREMEAKEKRKRMSEAALKAVKVAGGDVSVFEKAILA